MSEYIIINKTAIQKRIEELERFNYMQEEATTYKSPMHYESSRRLIIQNKEVILELKKILSQSTPLIPEIEKALKESIPVCDEHTLEEAIKIEEDYIKWYISKLKLDI